MNNKAFNFFVLLGKIGIVLMPLLLIGFIALFWIKKNFQTPVDYKSKIKTKFVIEGGSTLDQIAKNLDCLLYTSPSPRDGLLSRMPSSA